MSTVRKKSQPDLQLAIRCRWVPGHSVRAAYMMENIDFFEMLPAAAHYCGYDSVFSRPGRVAPADQGRCYPLSQVRLFDTFGSCWLKHSCVCLSACEEVTQAFPSELLIRTVPVQQKRLIFVGFLETFSIHSGVAVFQARCSELIQIDWTSFRNQWQHYFGCASSPGCFRINGKAIFCAGGRADLTSYRMRE